MSRDSDLLKVATCLAHVGMFAAGQSSLIYWSRGNIPREVLDTIKDRFPHAATETAVGQLSTCPVNVAYWRVELLSAGPDEHGRWERSYATHLMDGNLHGVRLSGYQAAYSAFTLPCFFGWQGPLSPAATVHLYYRKGAGALPPCLIIPVVDDLPLAEVAARWAEACWRAWHIANG